MDGYADDLAAVIETLGLNDVTVVGHSTGGAEVAHYIGRHGTSPGRQGPPDVRCGPGLVANRCQPRRSADGGLRRHPQWPQGRSIQFYKDLAVQFYGANRPGSKVSQGILDQFWAWSMQSGLMNSCASVRSLLRDFTEDLENFDVPTLILHGEDDQIVPVQISAVKSAGIIKDAKEIIYPGAPHGITATHQDEINSELLRFLESCSGRHPTRPREEGPGSEGHAAGLEHWEGKAPP